MILNKMGDFFIFEYAPKWVDSWILVECLNQNYITIKNLRFNIKVAMGHIIGNMSPQLKIFIAQKSEWINLIIEDV